MKYIIARDKFVYESYLKEKSLRDKTQAIWINNEVQLRAIEIENESDIVSVGPHFFGVTDIYKMALARVRNVPPPDSAA